MTRDDAPIHWLMPGQAFPDVTQAWAADSPAPGLLCAGRELTASRLEQAYRRGVFPWFSAGQPVLWWSPDPRMVLPLKAFKVSPSLKKTVKRFASQANCSIRIDTCFDAVMTACASKPRAGQSGTWIVPAMVQAYKELHARGLAHSVETWCDGELVGGLYCVAIGRAVFGESMFFHRRDASKIALAALVSLCRSQGVAQIDCQQDTAHLASLGAHTVARATFLTTMHQALQAPALHWTFDPVYWTEILV